ncbi:alpha/beta fold hydrolase [Dactylosporangium sp. CA-052675]|uniref:alpha/beta fold hydrolase n=1 Tax=Dactylosporangium sp. CA-052675 TaxID=3239927 RepID=UPI003D943BE1
MASTWWRIGPALAEGGWRVHAVDLPGHGRAPRLTGTFSLERFAALTAERLPERIDLLVGHSLGALVALMVAARRLRSVRALVLEDPPDALPHAGRPVGAEPAADRDAALRSFRALNPKWAEEDVRYAVDAALAADIAGFEAALATRPRWDLAALVAAVGVPTAVLAPPSDTDGALSAARPFVRDLVGRDRFVEIDCGHCAHRACPDLWLQAVTGFADAVIPPPRPGIE